MTTEMQEIAITEEKPLLTGQADTKVRPPHTHTHNIFNVYKHGETDMSTHECIIARCQCVT